MTSLKDLVDRVFTLFEDALQAAFISDFIMGKHIEAGFRIGYAKYPGGTFTFQLRCVAFRLLFVSIVHQFYKSQVGGFFSHNVTRDIPTVVKESQSVNARAARAVYRPLKEGQIRLVRLHPRHGEGTESGNDIDNKISCSLFTVNLDDHVHPAPEYEAVSYVWGSQSDLQPIRLNQERFLVTKQLSAALKALRLPNRDRILWVDALAIDQSSFTERASQVKKMQRIYSCARDTLIWLNDDSVCEIEKNPLWENLCSRRSCLHPEDLSRESELCWDAKDVSSLLSGLSNLQYWHRVWTAQEVVHSQRATLVTHSKSVSFGILDDLLAPEITEEQPTTRGLESSLKEFQKTCLTLRPDTISSGGWINLDTWYQMCISRNCSDPRDYVFGLCGCFPPEVRQQVRVDYFFDSDDVLKKATLAFLRHERCLDYLRHSSCFGQESKWINGLPSWVPAFTLEKVCKVPSKNLDEAPRSSTLGSEPSPMFLEALEDSNVLHVRGRWIGEVEKVDSGWAKPRHGETEESRALALFSLLRLRMFLLGVFVPDPQYTIANADSHAIRLAVSRMKANSERRYSITAEWCRANFLLTAESGMTANSDPRYDIVDEFCHALRAAMSGMTTDDVSILPPILKLQAPLGIRQRNYDQSSMPIFRRARVFGDKAVVAAYSTVTVLRLRDPRTGKVTFGITRGDGKYVKEGDKLCLLEGCSHALILRAESLPWWKFRRRHLRGQHRIIGSTVIRGGGEREQDWFKEIRAGGDLDDIFLR